MNTADVETSAENIINAPGMESTPETRRHETVSFSQREATRVVEDMGCLEEDGDVTRRRKLDLEKWHLMLGIGKPIIVESFLFPVEQMRA